jgi:hypothetical protein
MMTCLPELQGLFHLHSSAVFSDLHFESASSVSITFRELKSFSLIAVVPSETLEHVL